MSKNWKLTISLKVTGIYPSSRSSVMRLTNNEEQYLTVGSRIVAYFMNGNDQLVVYCDVGDDPNQHAGSKTLQVGKTSQIEMKQDLIDDQYIMTLTVNQEEIKTTINPSPRNFENVKVYAGDQFYEPSVGTLMSYEFQNLGKYVIIN